MKRDTSGGYRCSSCDALCSDGVLLDAHLMCFRCHHRRLGGSYGNNLFFLTEAVVELPTGLELDQCAICFQHRLRVVEGRLWCGFCNQFLARDNVLHSTNLSPLCGWVYVLSNPVLPGLLKIGQTNRSPEERVRELSEATGIPLSFVVEYRHEAADCVTAEKRIFNELDISRLASRREFFVIGLEEAITAVRQVCEGINLIHGFTGRSSRRVR